MKKSFIMNNPKGTKENSNDKVKYSVNYHDGGKYYYLCVTECTIDEWGGISYILDFSDRYATMKRVTRRSKKAEEACYLWLEKHLEALHDAYLSAGIPAVKAIATNAVA